MIKLIFYFALLFIMYSCSTDSSSKEEKSTLLINPSNSIKVKFKNKNSIVGQEVCALFYFTNDSFKIMKAYYDCENFKTQKIDTVSGEIKACKNKLYMELDTVKVCLVPTDTGQFNFVHRINLTVLGKNNQYYFIDTTFSTYVNDSIK